VGSSLVVTLRIYAFVVKLEITPVFETEILGSSPSKCTKLENGLMSPTTATLVHFNIMEYAFTN
jgi:hypothetical protein